MGANQQSLIGYWAGLLLWQLVPHVVFTLHTDRQFQRRPAIARLAIYALNAVLAFGAYIYLFPGTPFVSSYTKVQRACFAPKSAVSEGFCIDVVSYQFTLAAFEAWVLVEAITSLIPGLRYGRMR